MSKRKVFKQTFGTFRVEGQEAYLVDEDGKLSYWINKTTGAKIRNTYMAMTSKGFNSVEIPDPFEPKFPRFFVSGQWHIREGAAYIRFDHAKRDLKSVVVMLDGTERNGGVDYSLECSALYRREITEAEAKALVTPPKPVVRYFQPKQPTSVEADHIRFTGTKGTWVHPDGREEDSTLSISFFLTNSDQEVFPVSSETLRRSHRYAEKYSEGKAAGFRDADDKHRQTIKQFQDTINFLQNEIDRLKKQETSNASLTRVVNENNQLKRELQKCNDAYQMAKDNVLMVVESHLRTKAGQLGAALFAEVKATVENATYNSRLNVTSR